jgi:predicted esterase
VRVDGLVQITDQDGNEAGSGKLRVVFDAEGNPPDVAMPVVTRGVPVDADGLVFTVRDAAGHAYSAACWSRLERAPSALAAELVARANAMPEGDLSGARAAFLSRCALLVDAPAPDRSAEFLSPPFRLLPELRAEIEALEEGRDPYAGRPGGLWRTFALGRRARGFYVHAPASVAASQEPVPLVVALHGAGADEMFFPFASGAGHLVQLAEERGFLLACPRTADVSFNPRGFDALVETLAESYAVDRERVYVLGHSMGAMATANLTRKRGAAIARAVCIAGAQELGLGTPTLLLAGARDRVVSASGVRRAYEAARAAGAEVAYEEYAGGHTLPLARALTRAVQWFGLAP